MEFNNLPPKWDAQGVEPSADLQANGFAAGYKPPAPYFNYLFNKYTECLKELQEIIEKINDGTEAVGKAEKATQDGNGNNIAETYAPLADHKLKTYTELEQIGIKTGSETIDSIVSAMPLLSVLQVATSSANNMSIYPSVYGGTLRVEKSYGNRAKFTYFAQSYEWTGHHFNGTWYGWVDATPSNYLPINGGGTVYADNLRPIVAKNTADNQCFTRYDGKDSVLGFIGFAAENTPRLLDKSGTSLGDILHTGNSTADKVKAGTFGGRVQANVTAQATLADAQMRNIAIVATATEGATTTVANGTIVFSKE